MIKYVILGQPRSGTHLLHNYISDWIEKDPLEVNGEIEPLNSLNIIQEVPNQYKGIESIKQLENLIHKPTVISVHTIHLKQRNLTINDFLEVYPNVKFIVVNRVSKLDQYISYKLALVKDNWTHVKYKHKIGLDAISYYEYASTHINEIIDAIRQIEASSARLTTINFFDYGYNEKDLKRVAEEIGVKYKQVKEVYKKQRDKPREEYLTNPEVLNIIKEIEFKI